MFARDLLDSLRSSSQSPWWTLRCELAAHKRGRRGAFRPAEPKVAITRSGEFFTLTHDFVYTDPAGKEWVAPEGTMSDGASIPRLLWPIIGSPMRGKYVNAAILHDFYCSKRHEPWRLVHRMFHDAMLTSGVTAFQANIMYQGVYWGGPKWTPMDEHNASLEVRMRSDTPLSEIGPSSYVETQEMLNERIRLTIEERSTSEKKMNYAFCHLVRGEELWIVAPHLGLGFLENDYLMAREMIEDPNRWYATTSL